MLCSAPNSYSLKDMKTYVRVVWPEQREAVEEEKIIPTNHNRWSNDIVGVTYEPGTVVMLWDIEKESGGMLSSWIDGQVKDHGSCYVLKFEADIETEMDMTGWGQFGSMVHEGEIDLEEANIIEYEKTK